MNVYPWILTAFHGSSATGIWAACFGVVSMANPILFGIQNVLGPRLAHAYAEGGPKELQRLALTSGLSFSVVVLPISLTLIGFGDPILSTIYGDRYAGNGLAVAILGMNVLFSTIRFSYSRALFVINKASADFMTNVISLTLMVTLGLWLVMKYEVIGVALGLLSANLIVSGTKIVAFHSIIRSRGKGMGVKNGR